MYHHPRPHKKVLKNTSTCQKMKNLEFRMAPQKYPPPPSDPKKQDNFGNNRIPPEDFPLSGPPGSPPEKDRTFSTISKTFFSKNALRILQEIRCHTAADASSGEKVPTWIKMDKRQSPQIQQPIRAKQEPRLVGALSSIKKTSNLQEMAGGDGGVEESRKRKRLGEERVENGVREKILRWEPREERNGRVISPAAVCYGSVNISDLKQISAKWQCSSVN